jgi:hypothetical protein
MSTEPSSQPQRMVVVPTKNMGLAIILAFVFGPLGLLYSSVMGGVVMFFVNILVGVFTVGFGLLLTWPICAVWAYVAAKAYNDKLLAGQQQY